MVKLIYVAWCPVEKAIKDILKKNNIEYFEEDINVENNQDTLNLFKRLQIYSLPVIHFDDNNYVIGNNLEELIKLINCIKRNMEK